MPCAFDVIWLVFHFCVASEQVLDVLVLLSELILIKLKVLLLYRYHPFTTFLFFFFTA